MLSYTNFLTVYVCVWERGHGGIAINIGLSFNVRGRTYATLVDRWRHGRNGMERNGMESWTHWRPRLLWERGRFCIFKSTTKYKRKHSSTSWSRLERLGADHGPRRTNWTSGTSGLTLRVNGQLFGPESGADRSRWEAKAMQKQNRPTVGPNGSWDFDCESK